MNARLRDAPFGVLSATTDGSVMAANETAGELLGLDPASVAGDSLRSLFPRSVDDTVPRLFEGDGPGERTVEEYYPGLDRWLSVSVVPTEEAVTIYLQDVTAEKRGQERIDDLRLELDRLTMLDDLVAEVLEELVDASTREAIATTICERLGETDIYEFAWLGERAVGSDEITVSAAAGSTGRTFEAVTEQLGAGAGPEERVIETGEPTIVQPIGETESVPETVRRAAFAEGIQSLLAIPLTYGTNVYGVVGVYSGEQDAFSERERASFGTVGTVAGFAVNAARHRTLLLSDVVVELVFRVSDRASPLVVGAAETDATLSVEGVVPEAESLLCYLTVERASPDAVVEVLSRTDGVTAVRVIDDHGDGGSIEIDIDAETPLEEIVSRGGTIHSGTFEDAAGRVVVHLSPEEDVRRIADALTRSYDVTVQAKREREQSVATERAFRDDLRERLTDRQATALRTAYLADYFESPRGSSAEEVAGALDITGPTLLYHLRAGQRKLLDAFLETSSGPDHGGR